MPDAPKALRLVDYSDRELLQLLAELEDENAGWVPTGAISMAIGLPSKTGNHSSGSRMSYLKRIGAVEKDANSSESFWRLTPLGRTLAFGELTAAQRNALDSAKADQLLMLSRAVATSANGGPEVAKRLARREWTRSMGLLRP